MIELMDSTARKIVLAVKRGDSINRIANKIDISYSWVYDWVERLENANIITMAGMIPSARESSLNASRSSSSLIT